MGLISLGCAKNLVDAEIMLGSLLSAGMEVVNDPALADAVIVNTCSFIDAAQEESVDAILETSAARDAGRRGQAVIVAGCLSQRFRDELPNLFPEVDAFMGVDQIADTPRLVDEAMTRRQSRLALETPKVEPAGRAARARRSVARLDAGKAEPRPAVAAPVPALEITVRPNYIPSWETPRFRLTPRHYAFVKIAEGCNHPCSFCTIPRMRGAHRSRSLDDVVAEARRLLAEGVRELNLISQDSTYYGLDLRPNHTPAIASPARFTAAAHALDPGAPTLARLLRALDALPGDFWIRLLYTHPAHWTEETIQAIAECPKVARYIDMPLQHIHDEMLARMRRETDSGHIRKLVARLREAIPGVALRTTFIVGFPGETAKHFKSLIEFIGEARFERAGIFTYSQEEGTVAGRMTGQVAPATRQRRREEAMAAQLAVGRAASAAQVGRTVPVLIEGNAGARLPRAVRAWERRAHGAGKREDFSVGRSESDAPDIDGRVYVRGTLPGGEFARVRIVGAEDYDLIGEVARTGGV